MIFYYIENCEERGVKKMKSSQKILSNPALTSEKIYIMLKRGMDIIGSLLGIVIFFPLFIIIAVMIKIEDPKGSVFYAHPRLGKNGNMIPVYKFRSMYQNANEMMELFTEEQKKEYRETFKLKDDPRITRIGKFIRKTSLDELPQLVNVLKGEMSIVGPRPIVEAELEKYNGFEELFLSVQPGLTGLWQASGRSETTYDERVKMDVEYITNRNLLFDVKIILLTIHSVIKGKGAY